MLIKKGKAVYKMLTSMYSEEDILKLYTYISDEKLFDPDNKDPIKFYEKTEYNEFSNFYPRNKKNTSFILYIDGESWPDTELYFHVQKFNRGPGTTDLSHEYSKVIQGANTPAKVVKLANQAPPKFLADGTVWRDPKMDPRGKSKLGIVDNRLLSSIILKYTREVAPMRTDWDRVKFDIMRVANYHKYTQNPYLKRLLLETGDREIIEHSKDKIWGDGKNGKGQNWLGKILMETRYILSHE